MALRYSTPRDLVEALQQRGDGARAQLQDMLRAPLTRLMEELRGRYRLSRKGESLTHHALHAVETYLRTRSPEPFTSMTWPAFRAAVLLNIAKLASQPYGQRSETAMLPGTLPASLCYHSEAYFLPHERIGDYWFGGDWFGGLEAADGSLWVLLADITGHGYYAYLLASTLPGVWRACWESAPTSPADLLATMHDLLADCLPEGIYVECTLVRLHPEGEVVAAPAGGSRLLWRRRGQDAPVLLKLRGTWLGLARPSAGDQHIWTLEDGDELLLATDGMFDQLHDPCAGDVVASLEHAIGAGGLFERVRALLRQALEQTPQKDDITMVLLRRRDRVAEASAPRSITDLSLNETGDVPV
ncbi:MAG TPA: PP2C family protein-serine/threonine phosphatase [Gemmataceae bacterium]|nr:PP2C family protein-serine/threonine phosphatase [Gemmataceae bacterium]